MRKTGLKHLSALLAVIILAVACPAGAEVLREDGSNFFASADPKYAELIESIENTARRNSYSGSIMIATDDAVILYGGPRTVTTKGLPADPYTVYEIGSAGKTITAVVVLLLAEQGRLHLDDPLTAYYPEYAIGAGITIAHLLRMQSGITDYVNDPMTFFAGTDIDIQEMYMEDRLPDEVFLRVLFERELAFKPGTQYDYSNTNYHLLALIIEKVTGMSYGEAVRQFIFEPCGMERSSAMATGDETSVPESGVGYHTFQKGSRGAGDIHSCMADLLAFDRELFGGRLVSAESLRIMTDFQFDAYGCGLYPYGRRAYGHSGSVASYLTENVVFDSEAYGRVYMIASTSTWAGSYGLDALLQTALNRLGGR